MNDVLSELSWDELMDEWEVVHESTHYLSDEHIGIAYQAEDELIDALIERGKNES